MLTLLFLFLMFTVFGKLIWLAVRMTWGITKILINLVFLPVVLIGLVFSGLVTIAIPILVIVGIVALVSGH